MQKKGNKDSDIENMNRKIIQKMNVTKSGFFDEEN